MVGEGTITIDDEPDEDCSSSAESSDWNGSRAEFREEEGR